MDVPEGWEAKTLGEVAEVITKGTTPKTYGMEYTASGIPFLRVENITGAGIISLDGVKYISRTTHDALKRSQAKPGDMLFSIAGALGRAALVPESIPEANMNQAVALVRLRDGACHREYLRHALWGAQITAQVEHGKAALAQANLNLKQVAALVVAFPSLAEQRKIAAILSSVDEAIEKTQAVIDQVQVVKKGLMQELLTRGLPGLHKKFKQTELGEIPDSWEAVELGEALARIEAGWSPQCESHPPQNGEWGVLKVSAVSAGVYRASESKKYSGSAPPRPEIEVCAGDVLLARASGVLELVGKTVFVEQTRPMLMLSDKTLRLRPDESKISNRFLHNVMSLASVRGQLLTSTGGSHMRNVSQAAIRDVIIPLPPLEEQSIISSAERSISEREKRESRFLLVLSQLKQALMSLLLTGELRVTP